MVKDHIVKPKHHIRPIHKTGHMRHSLRIGFFITLLITLLLAGLTAGCQGAGSQDILTPAERAWLEEHPRIRIAPDPNFPPIEYFDEQGNYRGVVADYFEVIQQRLNYRFEIVRLETWDDVIMQAKARQIDGITAAQITPERSEYLLYTQPILDIPNVIIMRNDSDQTYQLGDMGGMAVAITRNNALDEYIRTNYPEITIMQVKDDLTALQDVSFGRADATVVNQAIASYLIREKGIANLRVVGDSGKTNSLSIATRSDVPLLNSIMKKGLAAVTQSERDAIYSRWVSLGSDRFWTTREFWVTVGISLSVLFLAFGVIIVWNRTLRIQVDSKTVELNRELAERRRAEEKIQQQLMQLSALHAIDLAISSSLDLRIILNILLEQVTVQLHVDAADVLMLNSFTQILEYAAGIGFETRSIERSRVALGDGAAGIVAQERRLLSIPDLKQFKSLLSNTDFAKENFISYFGVPLISKGQVKGVLEIFQRTPFAPDPEWLQFLETLAGQVSIAIDNAELFEKLQRSHSELVHAYEETIEGWSNALDLRDQETEGHSRRVTDMSVKLAREMGMTDEQVAHVRRGALLHDIGKMGVPDNILLKPGPLTNEEWQIMRKHPVYAFDMLYPITFLRDALDIPYCHHEKWDGSGYPRALRGEQIPLAARIFAIIDVWDALTSDRPYRKAWKEEQALQHIRQQSGQHFDPLVVEHFFNLLNDLPYR
mgnify:CR=1 FL=1